MTTGLVAEALIFPGHPQWPLTAENIDRVVGALQTRTGAAAVVMDVGPLEESPGWTVVPGTQYRLRALKEK